MNCILFTVNFHHNSALKGLITVSRSVLPLILIVILAAACQTAQPRQQYTKGDELAHYSFDQPGVFEEGAYGAATLRVVDGVYRIDVSQGDNTLWWGQWGDTYADTVIDVDVVQVTERNENAYGVMCRTRGAVGQPVAVDPTLAAIMSDSTPEAAAESTEAAAIEMTAEATTESTAEATGEADEGGSAALSGSLEGDGYLFLIQGNGQFAIMRSRGRSLTPLVDWQQSDKINQGAARNNLRAVCTGTYLAMYINGEFVADATDDAYREGQVGLAASAANRLGTVVEFDNLSVALPAT